MTPYEQGCADTFEKFALGTNVAPLWSRVRSLFGAAPRAGAPGVIKNRGVERAFSAMGASDAPAESVVTMNKNRPRAKANNPGAYEDVENTFAAKGPWEAPSSSATSGRQVGVLQRRATTRQAAGGHPVTHNAPSAPGTTAPAAKAPAKPQEPGTKHMNPALKWGLGAGAGGLGLGYLMGNSGGANMADQSPSMQYGTNPYNY